MFSDMSSTSSDIAPVVETGKFQVNSYHIFYITKNHIISSGVRLLDTKARYGDDEALIKEFRQLLPYQINNAMIFNKKLTPLNVRGTFYVKDFEKTMSSMGLRCLHMFLIHFPAAPNCQAKTFFNTPLQTETWLTASVCEDQSKINAVAVHDFSIKHLVQLTEVVAVSPMVDQMQWYSTYNYSYSGNLISNIYLQDHPVVVALARQHNISPADILMLWIIQRGETVIPQINSNTGFSMRGIKLNVRLTQYDLSSIDIAIMRTNSASIF